MIGAGVRDLYVAGRGFPSFIGVAQDRSGQAKEVALALAKDIGSTRFGVVEVTFAQEAELDLFTEQCFGPAFGHVLTTAVDVLLEEGYPPEAVLLELYMSGELSYTMGKIAELGLIEQSALHSTTSQYGSMSRGMRFILPELRARIREGLEEIRSGQFTQEWAAEQEAGCPTLKMLKESARSLPLHRLERELRYALQGEPAEPEPDVAAELSTEGPTEPKPPHLAAPARTAGEGFLGRVFTGLRRLMGRVQAPPHAGALSRTQMEQVLRRFVAYAAGDPALQEFARGRSMTMHYVLSDVGLEFYMRFEQGGVLAGMGAPQFPAEVRLETTADVLDGMFTGRINAMRAAMTGQLSFKGDAKVAVGVQQVQADLTRLYALAREEAVGDRT